MKIVILGGGIAGLAQGIFLKSKGYEVAVYERMPEFTSRGHAFLMNEEALESLNKYIPNELSLLEKQKVEIFSLKNIDEEELIKIPLEKWFCLKRVDLISFFASFYDHTSLYLGNEFSHFEYSGDRANAVIFKNGARVEADLFIGADGSNSLVRSALFGDISFSETEVKEIVGVSAYKQNKKYKTFQKFKSDRGGLSLGYIPSVGNECVWFMQYDVKQFPLSKDGNNQTIKEFCTSLLSEFPKEVKEVLSENDFSTTYVWNTRDFDLLPSFHKSNVVLVGDAAHLALPFTSAGTTNAILDASVLTECISKHEHLDLALNAYYLLRKDAVESHIKLGRSLKENFLTSKEGKEREFLLPLIPSLGNKKQVKETKERNPITIKYFTDPVCSTCWIFQPLLRKLKLEYEEGIAIHYHMGGLLPNWETYKNDKIKGPKDAARLWDEMRTKYNFPIFGEVWLNDPLSSSFPASIAFKAAQIQDGDKAISFLRRLKELLFIEKKNINHIENIENCALFVGLDAALLFKDMKLKAIELFEADLLLAATWDVKVFPTLIFEKNNKFFKKLKGLQAYEKIEEVLMEINPLLSKNKNLPSSLDLFSIYNNMTTKEFSYLLNLSEQEGNNELKSLSKNGLIDCETYGDMDYWKLAK